jgi:hypothetical protein
MNLVKLVLTGLALLLCIPAIQAQSYRAIEIPTAVIDQFTLSYPDAESIEWTTQNNKYLARFKNNKMETFAMLRKDGKLLQTETQIRIVALPPEATAYLQEEIKVKKIEAASIMEDETGVITFKAFVDDAEYWFDGNGHAFGLQNDLSGGPRLK